MTSGAAEAKVNASRTQAVCIFILVALVYLREKEHFFLRRCSGYFSIDFKTIKKFSLRNVNDCSLVALLIIVFDIISVYANFAPPKV